MRKYKRGGINLRKILIELYKKYKWNFLVETVFLIINVYLVAIPSRIVGNMIDLLYNVDANRNIILMEMAKLVGVCLGYLGVRVIWKNIEVKMEFIMSKDLVDRLFAKFLRSKIEKIEEIKNGKLMAFFVSDSKRVLRQRPPRKRRRSWMPRPRNCPRSL